MDGARVRILKTDLAFTARSDAALRCRDDQAGLFVGNASYRADDLIAFLSLQQTKMALALISSAPIFRPLFGLNDFAVFEHIKAAVGVKNRSAL